MSDIEKELREELKDAYEIIAAANRGIRAERAILARYEEALNFIAVGVRPDGTYNRSREVCGELARAALEEKP